MSASTELFPPVETAFGEAVRLAGLERVTSRYRELAARARRRDPTTLERAEINGAERVLETLQSMAPIGALQPARTKGQLTLSAGL